jgi:hypothetical protein
MTRIVLSVAVTAIVTIPLTTWAQQSASPCGWVLWTHTQFLTSSSLPPSWDVRDARPNYQECFDVRRRIWTAERTRSIADSPNVQEVTGVQDVFVTTHLRDGGAITVEFHCLPSQTDPRPR